jgi:hypothetical protein
MSQHYSNLIGYYSVETLQEEVGFFPVCICTVLVYLPDIGYYSVASCNVSTL